MGKTADRLFLIEYGLYIARSVQNSDDFDTSFCWTVEDKVLLESGDRPHSEVVKTRMLKRPRTADLRHLEQTFECLLCRAKESDRCLHALLREISELIVKISVCL